MDSTVYHCVNPYDVNPIRDTGSHAINVNQFALKLNTAATNGGSFYSPKEKDIKLEMEEFGDLAPYLHSTTVNLRLDPVDELNTPIFDRKGPFNFMTNYTQNNTASQSTTTEDPFKFEYDIFGNSAFANNTTKHQNNDISINNPNAMNVRQQENNSAVINNFLQGSKANNYFLSSEIDKRDDIYIFNNETPINSQVNGDQTITTTNKYQYIFEDNTSVVSVNSNVSSPCSDFKQNSIGVETPDDSNSCTGSEISIIKKVPKLKINLGVTLSHTLNIPNTPDIIDSVVSLESDSFNILDYANEKDITTVNAEDIHFEIPSTSSKNEIKIPKKLPPRKRKAKRYGDDDDDEDYLPPSVKSSRFDYDSDDSDSEIEVNHTVRRGRPPRRTSSISSDDASKYRELRDKNNEASRRSRLKRKVKEMSMAREEEELEQKNIKLKAQVGELEKMVENFRSNLFKVMLKK